MSSKDAAFPRLAEIPRDRLPTHAGRNDVPGLVRVLGADGMLGRAWRRAARPTRSSTRRSSVPRVRPRATRARRRPRPLGGRHRGQLRGVDRRRRRRGRTRPPRPRSTATASALAAARCAPGGTRSCPLQHRLRLRRQRAGALSGRRDRVRRHAYGRGQGGGRARRCGRAAPRTSSCARAGCTRRGDTTSCGPSPGSRASARCCGSWTISAGVRPAPSTSRPPPRPLLAAGAAGIVHVTDGGECTWFDLARRVVGRVSPATRVEPCTTDEFPRPAARPRYSVLDLGPTEALVGPMPRWEDEVDDVLARLEG